jgi:drug/metabolite transporter (DMT)-like permease
MSPTGVGFGLITAINWGSADFLGGTASRRTSPLATVLTSQGIALLIAIGILLMARETSPPPIAIGWSALAGCGAFLALVSLYRGLTTGAMGPVASTAALIGAGLPVAANAVFGNQLTLADGMGTALALVAILLVTRPAEFGDLFREGIGLGMLSGVGAGVFFIAISQSAAAGGGIWWPIAVSHMTCLALAAAFLAATGAMRMAPRTLLPTLVVIGLTDIVGAAFFLLADGQGASSLAAVIASQHPAATAILARIVLKERLAGSQLAAIVVALVAMGVIALS